MTRSADGQGVEPAASAAAASDGDAGHVCMLLPDPFPPDIRVRKEVTALTAAGYRVTVVANGPADRPARETVAGASVVRIGRTTPRDRATWLASAAVNLASAVHPRWLFALWRVHRRDPVDVLHVHDLPLGGTALSARRLLGVPVLLDLHENYPEAVTQWRRTSPGVRAAPLDWLKQRLFPRSRWRRLERRWVRAADHVVTVAPEAREHYCRDCDAAPADVTVVSNTVELARFVPDGGATPADVDVPDADESRGFDADESAFTVSYVGGFGAHRGLDTAIRAVARVEDTDAGEQTALVLVGGGGGTTEAHLRELVADLAVGDRVTITGWVDFAAVPGYVAASDVCLVPHAATPHTETTVPHKLFQYMAMAKPVVVTDVAPLARIVRETESGVVVPAGDPDTMADALRRLRDDPDLRATLGRNGRRAVETEYNWERDGERLLAVYEELLGDDEA